MKQRQAGIQEQIEKYAISQNTAQEHLDFSKIRIGSKTIDDAILNLGTFRQVKEKYADKAYITKLLSQQASELSNVSQFYYYTSGIYSRICRYLAFLYKYDIFVVPIIKSKEKTDTLIDDFMSVLDYIDNSDVKRLLGEIALSTIVKGAYYGIVQNFKDGFSIQELPKEYCRSRYKRGVDAIIEFNVRFFDDYFSDIQYKLKVLQMFPKEVQEGYIQYREGLLERDYYTDSFGWVLLDPDTTVRFSITENETPILANAIPSIIDLDEAQDLDRKKTMQQLLKIIIQKLPLDKNFELVFDLNEAQDIHNNAVAMLKRAIGVDVLTTFADIDVADMQDKATVTSNDGLQKIERTVFNNLGVSQNLFNTEGSVALEKSIANDEAGMRDLLLQFQKIINKIIRKKFDHKQKYSFRINILETTIYNYKEMSKLYKEQTQIGFSKLLPQIALGHTQSALISTAIFENNILNLNEIMVPPLMSSTMSSKNLSDEQSKGGRPELDNDQKADKTIKNEEAL